MRNISLKVIGSQQRLFVYVNELVVADYSIATSKYGFGEKRDSYKTPRGWHEIKEKIGAASPINSVFVARKSTGEIYNLKLQTQFPKRDWILTRILWLSGLESGKNLGGDVDTMQRYIYIHGTPDDLPLGRPVSRGCIRMRNHEVIALFDQVGVGTKIFIEE
jgi:lipoprotein-anchoring transpeptidase ErfK/SrfK